MEEYKTKRIRYVEVAKDIYAAITPTDGLDITAPDWHGSWPSTAWLVSCARRNKMEGLI